VLLGESPLKPLKPHCWTASGSGLGAPEEDDARCRRPRDVHPEAVDQDAEIARCVLRVDEGVRLDVEAIPDQQRARGGECHQTDVVHVDVAEHVLADREHQGTAVDGEIAVGPRGERPDRAGVDRGRDCWRHTMERAWKATDVGVGKIGHERGLGGRNRLNGPALPIAAASRAAEECGARRGLGQVHGRGRDDTILLAAHPHLVRRAGTILRPRTREPRPSRGGEDDGQIGRRKAPASAVCPTPARAISWSSIGMQRLSSGITSPAKSRMLASTRS
jgi:hypothetical protein